MASLQERGLVWLGLPLAGENDLDWSCIRRGQEFAQYFNKALGNVTSYPFTSHGQVQGSQWTRLNTGFSQVRSTVRLDMQATRFGEDPFDLDKGGHCLCETGEVAGYGPLSGITLLESPSGDLSLSDVYVGTRRGILRPYRMLIVSRRLFTLMQSWKLRGIHSEPTR